MADDVIQSKRIELVDERGNPVVALTAKGGDLAGLVVSSVEEDAPIATIGIDREYGKPFFHMKAGEGPHRQP